MRVTTDRLPSDETPGVPAHFIQPDLHVGAVIDIYLIGAVLGETVSKVDPGPDPPT